MASGDNIEDDSLDDETCYAEPQYDETREVIRGVFYQLAINGVATGSDRTVADDIAKETEPKDKKSCSTQLKDIALEIDKQYGPKINNIVKTASDITANYENFCEIANSLFEEEITMSRVLVLIMFGYRWLVQNPVIQALETVIRYLVRYLCARPMRRIIEGFGGWAGIIHTLSKSASLVFTLVACIFVVLAIRHK